jgi:hypothetical protein
MPNRPSRLMISAPSRSVDGIYHGRYPNGDAPTTPLVGAATDSSSARGSLTTGAGGFVITTPSVLPASTNGGAVFVQMQAAGGTAPYKWDFKYTTSAAITSITGTNPAVITLSTVSATHPFAGMTQAYITGYGAQGAGTTSFGVYNSLTVSIVSLGGSSGAWTITTNTNGTFYEARTGGTLEGGAIVGVTPAQITKDGWLFFAPTVNESLSCTIQCTDSSPTPVTISGTFTTTVNSALAIMGTALGASQALPGAMMGNKYRHQMTAAGGTGAGQVWSVLSGSAPGLSLSASGLWTGTPTAAGSPMVIQVADSGGNTATATFTLAVAANANIARPAYNSSASNGFFVLGGKLYDPNGAPIFIRGLNRNHIDVGSQAAFALTQQNAMRCFLATKFVPEATAKANISSQLLAIGHFPIVTRAADDAGNQTSGSQIVGTAAVGGNAGLGAIVSEWDASFPIWAPLMGSISVNIANEWGPANSTVWRDANAGVAGNISGIAGSTITLNDVSATNPFANAVSLGVARIKGAGGVADQLVTITGAGGVSGAWTVTGTFPAGYTGGGTLNGGAIGILRARGYTCPLVIDSGGSGQDINDFVNFSPAVFATDPLKNIIFAFHFYGLAQGFPPGSTLADLNSIASQLVSLRASVGAVYSMFEFGPGTPPGASLSSPTVVTAGEVITACEANSIPWLYWAFDDHNLTTNQWTGANWFGATLSAGTYAKPADLTYNGVDVVLNPVYGVAALATPASSFL